MITELEVAYREDVKELMDKISKLESTIKERDGEIEKYRSR